MYSFPTPCFRWKLLVAYKGQFGWPGFLAPHATRYLAIHITVTDDQSGLLNPFTGLPEGLPVTVNQFATELDRLTGQPLPGGTAGSPQFPYQLDVAQDMADNPGSTWEVQETWFKHVMPRPVLGLGGLAYTIIEVQLSKPYTTAQLEADADALLASIDPATMPWMTAQYAQYAETGFPIGPDTPLGDLTQLLPTGAINFLLNSGGPIPAPNLGATAWSIFAPGGVSASNWFPNGYMKASGQCAMVGHYCQKTLFLDYQKNSIDQTCVSGTGSCSEPFIVKPPPLSEGQLPIAPGRTACVNIVPNCQCGQ